MIIPTIRNRAAFQEDYVTQIKNASPGDAEDSLLELCDYIEPHQDGDHWLELTGDRTISGKPVYFWFTADMPARGAILTYHSWAHHY
ncbi:hypothetical protein [Lacticaseibacillus paracasei]|uniref:hypothetical protein n=1 Tax=Lacticaseibacillus paracasei TaxID=1597 RepID=UPI000FF6E594|nr:hypothetical protein [Lacticaseibacillus paracasei]RNE06148.1 hypothetical protein FAM22278_01880 [Lacticaseibacillus paracasei]